MTQRAPSPPLVASVRHLHDQSGVERLQDFFLRRLVLCAAQSQSVGHLLLGGADQLRDGLRREAVACDKRIGEHSVCAELSLCGSSERGADT